MTLEHRAHYVQRAQRLRRMFTYKALAKRFGVSESTIKNDAKRSTVRRSR